MRNETFKCGRGSLPENHRHAWLAALRDRHLNMAESETAENVARFA